jgi:hypothetical protein
LGLALPNLSGTAGLAGVVAALGAAAAGLGLPPKRPPKGLLEAGASFFGPAAAAAVVRTEARQEKGGDCVSNRETDEWMASQQPDKTQVIVRFLHRCTHQAWLPRQARPP